jgi:hypothetical protein
LIAKAQRTVEIVQISFANQSRWLKSKPFVARFAAIKFSTILDRISSLMCVIFRIAKKSLSVQRE